MADDVQGAPDLAALAEEGVVEFTLTELTDQEGEPTADDLRKLVGETELTDEELVKLYEDTTVEEEKEEERQAAGKEKPPVEGEEKAVEEEEVAAAAWDRPWEYINDKGEQITGQQWMDEALKAQVRFKVNGQVISVSPDELVRQAQRQPMTEQRISTVVQQRNQEKDRADTAAARVTELAKNQELILWAMQDETGERFRKLQEQFRNEEFSPAGVTEPQPIYTPDEVNRAELLFEQNIRPHLSQMAAAWSQNGQAADPQFVQGMGQQIEQFFRTQVAAEGRFMDDPTYGPARLQQIITEDLPHALQQAGLRPVAGPAPVQGNEVATLKAELANLKSTRQKEKLAAAPGGGSGTSGGETGSMQSRIDKMKSAKDVTDALNDPTFGLEE